MGVPATLCSETARAAVRTASSAWQDRSCVVSKGSPIPLISRQRPMQSEPGRLRSGWQHTVASRWNCSTGNFSCPEWPNTRRSQSGPATGMSLSTTLPNPEQIESQLLRRLRLSLPLTSRKCRCGRLLDSFGHHRAACAQTGVLGRRGFAIECWCAKWTWTFP